jgi:hypothetical protein
LELAERLLEDGGGGPENAVSFGLEMALSGACPSDMILP